MASHETLNNWDKYATIATMLTEKEASALRIDSLSKVIQYSMIVGGKADYSFTDIQNMIRDKLRFTFPENRLKEAWKLLLSGKEVVVSNAKNPEQIRISSDVQEIINNRIEQSAKLKKSVIDKWIEGLISKYGGRITRQIFEDGILRFVGALAAHSSGSAIWALNNKRKGIDSIADLPILIQQSVASTDKEILNIAREEFPRFFVDKDPDRAEYIQNISEGVFEIGLQNISFAEQLLNPFEKDLILYLDTNVIFSLLGFDGDEEEDMVKKFIAVAKSIKAKLMISFETKKQILGFVNIANELYILMNAPKIIKGRTAGNLLTYSKDVDNAIIRGFIRRAAIGRSNDWNKYIAELKSLTSLLKQYGIITDDTGKELLEDPALDKLKEIIIKHGPSKTGAMSAEHDAFHYLLINKLRKTNNASTNVWFISRDRTLFPFDSEANALSKEDYPCFAMSPVSFVIWIDCVSPTRLLGEEKELYLGNFICSIFPYHRSHYDSKILLRLAAVFDDMGQFPDDLMIAISTKMFAKHRYDSEKSLHENIIEFDKSLASQIQSDVQASIDKQVIENEKGKRMIEDLNRRVSSLEGNDLENKKTMDEQRVALSNQIDANKGQKRTIMILINVILLLGGILLLILLKRMDMLFVGLLILFISNLFVYFRKSWLLIMCVIVSLAYGILNAIFKSNHKYSFIFDVINYAIIPLTLLLTIILEKDNIKKMMHIDGH